MSDLIPQAGKSVRIHYLVWLIVTLIYTLVTVNESLRQGVLALPPTYDDIIYFNDGLDRLQVFYNGGFLALTKDLINSPPHSPFSTLEAFFAFAIFGVHHWAPALLNGLLVLPLLAFVEYLGRELPPAARLVLVSSCLSWPLTENLILECRPDTLWGLLNAAAVVLVFEGPWLTRQTLPRVAAGVLFGLALLTKPSAFPVTIVTAVASLGIASVIDLLGGNCLKWRRVLVVNGLTLGIAFLIALPYYLTALSAITQYIVDNYNGFYGAWAIQQGLLDNLTYYLDADRGGFVLGQWLWVWGALVGLCSGVVLSRRLFGQVERALGLAIMIGLAYLIVTVSAVKGGILNPFLGSELHSLILLTMIQMTAWLHGALGSRPSLGWVKTLGVLALAAISLGTFKWHLRNRDDVETIATASEIKYRRGIAQLLYQTITQDAAYRQGITHLDQRPIVPFFLGSTAYLNDSILDFMFKHNYYPDTFINARNLHNYASLALGIQSSKNPDQPLAYLREIDPAADYVVAFSADNQDRFTFEPGANLQAQLLAALDQDPNFNLLQTYPNPYGGGKVLLYVKTPPFTGLAQPTNLGPLEKLPGGDPWSGRWGYGPRTTFGVNVNPSQSAKLLLTATALTPGQVMSIKVDGRLVSVHRFTKPAQYDSWGVSVPPGAHRVEISYQHWTSTARDPRPLAVLFRRLALFMVPEQELQLNSRFTALYGPRNQSPP